MTTDIIDQPNKHNNNNNISPQRIVIFFGPHKTASTSIEKFLVTHAGDHVQQQDEEEENSSNSFNDWIWPTYRPNDDGNALYRINRKQKPNKLQIYQTSIQNAIRTTKNHVILGTENLDKFDETGALELLWNWTSSSSISSFRSSSSKEDDGDEVEDDEDVEGQSIIDQNHYHRPIQYEFIVNHRTPRIDHLISVWKQNSKKSMKASGWSFYDYWCLRKKHPYPTAHHSLHLVQRLLQFWTTKQQDIEQRQRLSSSQSTTILSSSISNTTTTTTTATNNIQQQQQQRQIQNQLIIHLIDMAGITHAGLDISHVVACQILKVPCQRHRYHSSTNESTSSSRHDNNGDDGVWVQGLDPDESIIQANTGRSEAQPELNITQLQAIDSVLRQYDCTFSYLRQYNNSNNHTAASSSALSYGNNSSSSPWVRILYPHELFKECPPSFQYLSLPPSSFSLPPTMNIPMHVLSSTHEEVSRADPNMVQERMASLRDYDLVTQVIREILQCPATTSTTTTSYQSRSTTAWDRWKNLTESFEFSKVKSSSSIQQEELKQNTTTKSTPQDYQQLHPPLKKVVETNHSVPLISAGSILKSSSSSPSSTTRSKTEPHLLRPPLRSDMRSIQGDTETGTIPIRHPHQSQHSNPEKLAKSGQTVLRNKTRRNTSTSSHFSSAMIMTTTTTTEPPPPSSPPLVQFGPSTIIIMTTSLVIAMGMVVWVLFGGRQVRKKLRIRRGQGLVGKGPSSLTGTHHTTTNSNTTTKITTIRRKTVKG